MITIKKSHVIIAGVAVVIGGIVIAHVGHHHSPVRQPKNAGTATRVGTPIAPTTGTTSGASTSLKPWTEQWNIDGSNAVGRHFHESNLSWIWVVPQGSPDSYLWLSPYPVHNAIQYGIESPTGWTYGTYLWPPTPHIATQNPNPVSMALGLMAPLIGKSGSTPKFPASIASQFKGSSTIGLQVYEGQNVEPYQLEALGAQDQSAGTVDVTFVVNSPLPPGMLGPIYYSPNGTVEQDLTFEFKKAGGGWAWTGFYENPIAANQIQNQLVAPQGPVLQ